MQRVETVEELEFHAATSQCLIQRCDHDIAHPGRHLPENRSPVTEEHLADQECHHAGTNRGSARVTIAETEHQVIHAAHHCRVENIRMCAVPKDPVAEVLIVDGREPIGVGDQLVGDDAAHGSDDQGYQHPTAPAIHSVVSVDRVAYRKERVFDDLGSRGLAELRISHCQ